MNQPSEKSIQLESVLLTSGLGDIAMGILGLMSLREARPEVCRAGQTTVYCRKAAVDIARALLPDLTVDTLDHSKGAPIPRYSIGPKMRPSTLWKSLWGSRWTVDPAYSERVLNFGTKPMSAFEQWCGRLQNRLYGIHDPVQRRFPSYKGHEMWVPLANRLGVGLRDMEKASYAAMSKASAYLDAWLETEGPDHPRTYDILIFPSAMAFQFIPSELCSWLRQQLPNRTITICLPENDTLLTAYQNAEFSIVQTPTIPDALRLMKRAKVVVTPDSLTGHLAPLLARKHVHLFSHEMLRANLHPAAASFPIYDHLVCSPCRYVHRKENPTCAAGHSACLMYGLSGFRNKLLRALD